MRKKVLFLIHDLGGGGAEKVLVNLVNNMNHEKYNITVVALFGGGVNEQFLSPNVAFYSVWKRSVPGNSKLMKLLSPKQLHRICIKGKYDVEIAYLEGPSARIISGCSESHTKLIAWIHGQQHSKKRAASSFRNYAESEKCYARYERLVAVSENVKDDFITLFPKTKDMIVKYNTIDTNRMFQLMNERVDDVRFSQKEINIIAVGKITHNKGFDRIALIIKKLHEDGFPIHFYALGEGEDRETIETYVYENGIENNYTFLGYKTNPYKYIVACDLFICASWSEGFSTAATEALVLGVPVCTVNVSGMKEMLGSGNEWGIVTDNDNEALYQGIKWLISDSERLKYYKKKAIERGRIFSAAETVQAVEKMIDEVMAD